MRNKKKYFTFFLFILSFYFCFGQQSGGASACDLAEPICSSSELSFVNTSNGSTAELGPNYGCLATQPNPAWFFLQIDSDGQIVLSIQQSNTLNGNPTLDVDFILYGPFVDVLDACNSGLTSSNTIDCSYSSSSIEEATIPNAISGEFYLLLITNFSGQAGFISINQSSGGGSTDCSIVEELKACDGESLELNAQTTDADSFLWYQEDPTSTGSFLLIPDANEEVYFAMSTNNYMAEVFNAAGVLLSVFEFGVEFLEKPVISNTIDPYIICDNLNENDGIGQFELDSWNEEVLNGLDEDSFSVSYFLNALDADLMENQLPNTYVNTLATETIFVRIDNSTSVLTECFIVGSFDLLVILKPEIFLNDYYICTFTNGTEELNDLIIETGLSALDFSFEWTETSNPNIVLGTDSFYLPMQAGNYSVLLTDNFTGCFSDIDNPNTISIVKESSPPLNLTADVITQAFDNTNVIEANVISDNEAIFEFSLDNGPYETNGTDTFLFTDVTAGNHTVTARDINGCGKLTISVLVVGYPSFFSPNNDGYNDTWQIVGFNNQLNAKIYIFDRYGKLLKQISPGGIGWDGTFNGKQLPPSDYWFSLEYIEPNNSTDTSKKEFISHFTLKR